MNYELEPPKVSRSTVVKGWAHPVFHQLLARGVAIAFVVAIACAIVFSAGCGRGMDRSYAAHSYPTKTNSINGLGFLEKLCLQKAAKFKSVNRLSPRLDRFDCLILIGNTMHPPAKESRDWIEEWLASKSGRKVIYFGRDFDASEIYMQETLDDQPDANRRRAGLDLAFVRSERDELLYEQMDSDYFCRWFYVRVSKPERVLEKFTGPWSQDLTGSLKWPVRAYLDIPDQALRDKDEPDWTVAVKTPPTFPFPLRRGRPGARVRPAPPASTPTPPRSVMTSVWVPRDIGDAVEWDKEWDLAPQAQPLLIGEDGTPVVMKLTSNRYPGSKILVLANGAPLFNGMMIDADMRTLCASVANEIGDNAKVAMLPFNASGIQVSRVPDSDEELAGLSVLMTWPLNILMAHLAFLGVLVCVALFPILGRPQRLKRSNTSDFGQHAEAMGQLMHASRDLPYALQLVCDYLRIVRGETVPAWLESELVRTSANRQVALPVSPTASQPGSPPALPPPTSPSSS